MVAHAFKPSTQEAVTGRWISESSRPGLHSMALPQNQKLLSTYLDKYSNLLIHSLLISAERNFEGLTDRVVSVFSGIFQIMKGKTSSGNLRLGAADHWPSISTGIAQHRQQLVTFLALLPPALPGVNRSGKVDIL